MESYSVEAILSAVDDSFTSTTKKAGQAMGDLDNQAQKTNDSMRDFDEKTQKAGSSIVSTVAKAGMFKLVSGAIDLVKDSVGGAISRMDTLNNSTRSFENMGFTADETAESMENLQDGINGLPTPLDQAVQGVQMLAASTGDIGTSTKVFNAMNDAILGFGGSTAMVDNAVLQLSQSFANGKIDAQTWNSMLNSNMGPTLNAIAKQMGITTGELKEGLSQGEISIESFQDALIDLDENGGGGLKSLNTIAQDATKGIGTSMQNMKTAVVKGVMELIKGFDTFITELTGSGIADWIKRFGDTFKEALEKAAAVLENLAPKVKKLAEFLKPLAPLLFPIVGAITGIVTATAGVKKVVSIVTGVKKAFTGLFAVISANPIALLVGAIVGLVAGFVYLWNTSEEFRNFWINLWEAIKDAATTAVEAVKNAWGNVKEWFIDKWSGFKEFFTDMWQSIKDTFTSAGEAIQAVPGKAADSIKEKWSGVKSFFTDLWADVKESIQNTWSSITGFFSDKWAEVKETTKETWGSIVDYFTPIVETITAPFEPMKKFFSGLWDSVKSIFKSEWEIIKSIVMGPVLFITDLITGEFGQLKEDFFMIWNTIKENVLNVWTTIQETILNYVTAIVETVQNLLTILLNFIVDTWNNLVSYTKQLLGDLKTWFLETIYNIVNGAKDKWSEFKTWFLETIDNIVEGAKTKWNDFKTSVTTTFKETVQSAKDKWSEFKEWFPNMVHETSENVKQKFRDMKDSVIDTFHSIVQGAKDKWNNMVDGVMDMVDKVKGWFERLRDINLLDIGRAIMDSFFDGLKSTWGKVQDFVGGIGDWIRDHKGPIRKDKKLLIPAGQAIMNGLDASLIENFKAVKNNVSNMAAELSNAFGKDVSFDIGSSVEDANKKIDTTITHNVNRNTNKKPAVFNLRLGKQNFKAFVDDIGDELSGETDINLQF